MVNFERRPSGPAPATSLVDILDRVLDKGLVVAGDIRISLANIELLTIKIRLLVCSIDKAAEIGLDWWRRESFLSSAAGDPEEVAALRARVAALERQVTAAQQSEIPVEPPAAPARRRRHSPGAGPDRG